MDIYLETIKKFGVEPQLDVMVEECAELIFAIQKWKRWKRKLPGANIAVADIIGECVDVEIMLEQLKRIFPNEKLWDITRSQKLLRMRERLERYAEVSDHI